ncbi:ABC transporter ATP-binding protein [Dactylosporangium sp. NPDC005555]|uniref:ABC transporter ATP-binding protein n=1 Tax=Dactylosporangium sp. NPDC005555 TaxID=3154889 RepID=UPI0033BA2F99
MAQRGALGLMTWGLRETGGRMFVAWLFGLTYQSGLVLLPWCLGRALDEGITGRDRGALLGWAGAVLGVSVLLTAGELGMRWFSAIGASRTGNRLIARLTAAVLRLDRGAVGRFGHGDLVTRGTRDAEAVHTWLRSTPSLLSGVLGFCGAVVVVALLDPALAVVGVATVPVLILVNLWYPPRFERAGRRVSEAHSTRADAVEDLLSASTAVRGLGGERVLVERHHARSAEVTSETVALARIAAGWSAHAPFVPAIASAVGLLAGGLAVLDGRISVGTLLTFTTWMALLSLQVITLTDRFGVIGLAWTAGRRIAEVLEAEPAIKEPEKAVPLPRTGELATAGLRVELPDRAPLHLPDLRVRPGEFVVLTGLVGSGKTTLLRLLARLADPAGGTVTYGGVDLRDAALADLRRTITIVGQRPQLLSGTIRENLLLGIDEDADLDGACHVAAVDEFVGSLPDRYDTLVGERGSTLSGGQVQRIAVARALLRRAPVLLLDDVTSAVDAGTETAILDRLRDWAPGTTVVAATSRPEVMARADRLISLDTSLDPREAVTAGSIGG